MQHDVCLVQQHCLELAWQQITLEISVVTENHSADPRRISQYLERLLLVSWSMMGADGELGHDGWCW
jgi:hypothetical protein